MSAGPAATARRGFGRRRAAVLILIHVLIGLHIAHWLVAGRTLAPLEFNEVMHTLELGLITAGFLLMATAVLATALVGRFFCGWACHVLALQDLCAWLLARFRIAARPVRSRTLRIAPFAVAFYMFLWPQVVRLWRGEPAPELRVAGPDAAWASLVTDDFWRNLPGPWIAGLTFLVCGFAVVWMLGSRGFCQNGCPYGAVFAAVQRLAPGSIRLRGACTDCGRCTAVCQSGIWVHAEVQRFGMVVGHNCLRDLDCVAACPESALSFGVGLPAGLRMLAHGAGRTPAATWRFGEDCLAGAVMVTGILAFRGLYDAVPFLMAVGIGACLGALAVLLLRLLHGRDLGWRRLMLRRRGRLTRSGLATAATAAVVVAFTVHSAVVRWHEATGLARYEYARSAEGTERQAAIAASLAAHQVVEGWGLWNPVDHSRRLASLYAFAGAPALAEDALQRVLAHAPDDHAARLRLAAVMAGAGRGAESVTELQRLAAAQRAGVLDQAVRSAALRVADRALALMRERGDAAGMDAASVVLEGLEGHRR